MSAHQTAVDELQAKVVAMLQPGMKLAFATDAMTYAKHKRPTVLLAIARPEVSFVMAFDAVEFDLAAQLDLAKLCGFEMAPVETAMEKALDALPGPSKGKRR